jgi:hypothetical protein
VTAAVLAEAVAAARAEAAAAELGRSESGTVADGGFVSQGMLEMLRREREAALRQGQVCALLGSAPQPSHVDESTPTAPR